MKSNAIRMSVPVLLLAGIFTAQAQAASYTLSPTDDTYVDFSNANTNFGDEPGMVTFISFLSDRAFSYLKFDLGAIPANEVITGATLNLFQQGINAPFGAVEDEDLFLYTDNWSESTVTWNNAPPIPGPRLATDDTQTTGWIAFDLFELGAWDPAADQADGFLSLALREGSSGDSAHGFCTKESDPALDNCLVMGEIATGEDRDPFLTLQTTVVPVPPALLLFVSALGLLTRVRRRQAR